MVCEPDETDLDIQIPAVMLPQDAGVTLQKLLSNGSSGRNLWVIEMTIYHHFQTLLTFFWLSLTKSFILYSVCTALLSKETGG